MLFVTDGTIMSGLNPEAPELELPEWHEDVKVLKGFFKSILWKYLVHAFIGEVVKGQSRL